MFADLSVAVGGVVLLMAAGGTALYVLLSYVRSPVGQHKDAGEGALTVAVLQERSTSVATVIDAEPAETGLFGVALVSGYVTMGATGKHHAADVPGPSVWTTPGETEQTREIPGVLMSAA